MNVGVIADLRGIELSTVGTELRALLTALSQAKQPGDRFSFAVAGAGGGLLLAPEQFRFGPLSVALQQLAENPRGAPVVDLQQALALTAAHLRQENDAVLVTSLVLLLAAAPLSAELPALEGIAHGNALDGIILSAVALGRAEPAAVQRLVVAGQGRLHSLTTPAEAGALLEQELYAASRAVARALRLRIRLAPGVKLVEVVGSQRLDQPALRRVREQEQSIDRRLAQELGIAADRGEDEEGIQIVIPHFYAAAEHAILLDVVVSGPGPVADVTVRYKDLVYLRNGLTSAQFALAAGVREPGPLERNVLKNHLALVLAQGAERASGHLAAGDRQRAAAELAALKSLWEGLRQALPGWRQDAELRHDERLLADYLRVLTAAANDTDTQGLAVALRYSAYRKLLGDEVDR